MSTEPDARALGAIAGAVANALVRQGAALSVREETLAHARLWLDAATRGERHAATVELLALAAKVQRLSPEGAAVEQLVELAATVVEERAGRALGRL